MSLIKSNFPLFNRFPNLLEDDWLEATNKFWSPAVNIVDKDDHYEIEIAAPGFKKNEIKVRIDQGLLVIEAENKNQQKEEEKNYTRKEFSYRSFQKSFSLPSNMDESSIKADFNDGLLKINLDKSKVEIEQSKEIKIH